MTISLLNVQYAQTGSSTQQNPMGMREMQAKAFAKRDAQYLLLKAPPASGKSRALMFLALDKLRHQGVKKAIIAVPEMSIGGSFADTDLSEHGFFADWRVKPENNLCTGGGADGDKGKVDAFKRFMKSSDKVLVCTHATFRFAFDALNDAQAFDDVLVAIDEFHHVSAEENNRLGGVLDKLMRESSAHIVAMTGSYFRGDTVPILTEEDEAKFEKVTYTYYEQLNGYKYLKSLGLGYHFYQGRYFDALAEVLDSTKKTIIHIPNVNSGEAAVDKYTAVDAIIDVLGEFVAKDRTTGIITVKTSDGRLLKLADLVDDRKTSDRALVQDYLRRAKKRDDVDIIVALGMAKEGFDWPFCEHVLTIGYRSSMTEVVQIIGRATRDCEGKSHAQFTNLIAQPDAADADVANSVNNLLKAITLSLLMEQVLAPNITFRRRSDMKEGETPPAGTLIVDDTAVPVSKKVLDILNSDSTDIIAALTQNPTAAKSYVNQDAPAQTVNEVLLPQIVAKRYPDTDAAEQAQIVQGILTQMAVNSSGGLLEGANLPENAEVENEGRFVRQGEFFVNVDALSEAEQGRLKENEIIHERDLPAGAPIRNPQTGETQTLNNQFVKMGEKFINVDKLNIDLIRAVNPFQRAYEVLSKNVDSGLLKAVQNHVEAGRIQMSEEEAVMLWPRIQEFVKTNGRHPSQYAEDVLEKRMAEALIYIRDKKAKRMAGGA
ncbi:DEAD/DEAH box helicase [Neisseria sp.]|uniref:DEAD/DEAH box helicase n=1 Tax=Neisseria sp. TaxID=192066 RepID=UPI0026DAC155|nr:helicase-related protein [Neisseria sp.]MDO4908036.1 helicase-related protein [Neisseria sp.]